jgi:glycerol-3-phosphate dehydrogenase subunit C
VAGEPVSFLPTDGLSYDPAEPRYWDAAGLDREVRRVFEVCNGCRLCFKYCDAFPTLFGLVDRVHDGDVGALTTEERSQVESQCFQCKLCEVQCPYTPRDGHAFQLDFPKLIHRCRAQGARTGKPRLRDRLLGDPDRMGRLARMSLGLANWMNRRRSFRWLLEKVLGVHREKALPPFARRTFTKWAKAEGLVRDEPGGEAVLFGTCFVEHNAPSLGKDAVEVYKKCGVDLRCAEGLACCGMPAWEHGDLDTVRAKARENLDALMPFVDRDALVVVVNPTCSMMLRREWPELLEGVDRQRAIRLAHAVRDASEHLWSIRNEPRFSSDFRTAPKGKVAYHAPCHLRTQGVGFKGRDLIKRFPDVDVDTVQECSGHDGTWSMTTEGFEPSKRIGSRCFDGMREAEAALWVTDCPLAAIQLGQHAGTPALHPLTVLARAYRGEPFPEARSS